MSVINDAQTNRVCALSIHSYFCLNTASVLQSATLSERSRNPRLGCIPSTFDRPVEKHCNILCLTHRRVTIGSTQRSIEVIVT